MCPSPPEMPLREELVQWLLVLGDDRLVLGHRLSEWCGHAPILEEDIALANIGLDCIGHASALLGLAGKEEGKGRSEDDLAYLREAIDFRNHQICELPKGDFAFTIVRQFLVDSYAALLYEVLKSSTNAELAAVAAKVHKEVTYHLRHSSQWFLRLGDGTEESHRRTQQSLDALWMYTGELFGDTHGDVALNAAKVSPLPSSLRATWKAKVSDLIRLATLSLPSDEQYMASGSRSGRHTEHLGHLLAEMQILPRSFPGASW